MPGFTAECTQGLHGECHNRDCRCSCHDWTQELMRQKQPQPGAPAPPKSPRGTRAALPPKVVTIPERRPNKPNRCPKCKKKYPREENFCRRDGAKLLLGNLCQRCGEGTNAGDKYCFACGQNLEAGMEAPPSTPTIPQSILPPLPPLPAAQPTRSAVTLPDMQSVRSRPTPDSAPAPLPPGVSVIDVSVESEQTEQEDPLLRLQRRAREQGLLPNAGVTTVT